MLTTLIIYSGVVLCVADGFVLIWLYGRPWFLDFELFGTDVQHLFHVETIEASQHRVRPCLMTTATTALALLPVITSQGRGADLMVPMTLPSVGGMGAILLTLVVGPVLYAWVEEHRLGR